MKKNQNGITLIALVITIIVLLILAGVSISAISGENGIVTKAKDAAQKTETAQKEEEDYLKELENHINNSTDEKNQYGFYFDREYICYNARGENSIISDIFKENNTIEINVVEGYEREEGSSVALIDFAEVDILTIDSLEYNKTYSAKGTFDSDCTWYFDDSGILHAKYIISGNHVQYSENQASAGNGAMVVNFSEDGKSFEFNGNTYSID